MVKLQTREQRGLGYSSADAVREVGRGHPRDTTSYPRWHQQHTGQESHTPTKPQHRIITGQAFMESFVKKSAPVQNFGPVMDSFVKKSASVQKFRLNSYGQFCEEISSSTEFWTSYGQFCEEINSSR